MPRDVVIIKKKTASFDGEIAILDADRTEAIFALHLSRCNDAESAGTIADIFAELGQRFAEKRIALSA